MDTVSLHWLMAAVSWPKIKLARWLLPAPVLPKTIKVKLRFIWLSCSYISLISHHTLNNLSTGMWITNSQTLKWNEENKGRDLNQSLQYLACMYAFDMHCE